MSVVFQLSVIDAASTDMLSIFNFWEAGAVTGLQGDVTDVCGSSVSPSMSLSKLKGSFFERRNY